MAAERVATQLELKSCLRCHALYAPRPGVAAQKFCSELCGTNYRANGALPASLRCEMCRASFAPRRVGAQRPSLYCSQRCKGQACRLWAKYRMRPATYLDLLERQGGGCAICGKPPTADRALVVDHDHACCPYLSDARHRVQTCGNCNRGLLCVACNVAIGHMQDDPDRLVAAAAYLLTSRDVLGLIKGDAP